MTKEKTEEMTMKELIESKKDFLVPSDISSILGCQEQSIRLQAEKDPSRLGFAVVRMGTRTLIPRLAFIHWYQYGNTPVMVNSSK